MDDADKIRLQAQCDLIGRTGSKGLQIRWSDDEVPTVWLAVALYDGGRWEVGAGRTPLEATTRLCENVLDGGTCTHCQRAVGFDDDFDDTLNNTLAAAAESLTGVAICWYMWDPELKKYRRGCEGER